ncbi:MAG: aldo/keto reductase [Treponema sp.]|jgi:diketogulonate reductase-like aldo/keto reductase|nr:aldo/keto reductase [Treponema sp.]
MKSLTDCYRLSNGVEIPCIGFGTWQTPDGAVAVSSVKEAVIHGYRHIDTAAAYGNEESVGEGIRQSGVPRKELFITTKLWNDEHGYDATLKAFDLSLKKLGLDYLDLYLIHWPNPVKFRENWQETNAETWRAFEELYKAGRVRAIGISNFRPHHVDALLKTAKVVPQVNQIRLCPGDTQDEAVSCSRKHKMLLEAYSPLGVGAIFKVPELQEMAEKYGKTVAQICIRWSLQMEFLPLPKSVTPARIRENTGVFDFELSGEDVKKIAALKGVAGYAEDPDTAPF